MTSPQFAHDLKVPAPVLRPAIPAEWKDALNALRIIALKCRSAPRADLFEACALLSIKSEVAQDAHARALLKCLRQAVAHPPIFYRPEAQDISFDEAWLVQSLIAAHKGDADSFAFLIRSRVFKVHQRQIAFLIKGIARKFTPV